MLISHDKIDFMIVGDLNIDLLLTNPVVNTLISVTKSFNLEQLIKQPTRVTIQSSTLLDPIFVFFPHKIRQSGCFSLTNSDHHFVYCVFGKLFVKKESKLIEYRTFKNVNCDIFKQDLDEIDWSRLYNLQCETPYRSES